MACCLSRTEALGRSAQATNNKLQITVEEGALERTRTSDPQLRKLMLYPLSYERVWKLKGYLGGWLEARGFGA